MPFTKENAAQFSILGHAARWHNPKPPMPQEDKTEMPENVAKTMAVPQEVFREKAAVRVREHIERLQERIDDLLDRRDLDVRAMRDLAEAVLKLESVEQKLSGRPGPGNLRPVAMKPAKRATSYPEPIPQFSVMHEPAPVIDLPAENSVSGDWRDMLF